MEQNNTPKTTPTHFTVPEFDQLDGTLLALSDYALDNGAGSYYRENNGSAQAKTQNYGECWVRSANNGLLGADTYRQIGGAAQRMLRSPDNYLIGVAPTIENATADHWGKTTVTDGTTLLTKNNQLTFYPRTRVNDALAADLTAAHRDDNLDQCQLVGAYHRPVRGEQGLRLELDMCYAYRGQCYVHCHDEKRDAWYHCEPCRVLPDTNADHLQVSELLFNAPFDTSSHFATLVKAGQVTAKDTLLEKFLNHEFMHDLVLSTELAKYMKLTHTQDVFHAENLQGHTVDMTTLAR